MCLAAALEERLEALILASIDEEEVGEIILSLRDFLAFDGSDGVSDDMKNIGIAGGAIELKR